MVRQQHWSGPGRPCRPGGRRWNLTGRAVLVLIGAGVALAACSSSPSSTPTTRSSHPATSTSTTSTPTTVAGPSTPGSPPPVPASGAQLGAYLHPAGAGGTWGTGGSGGASAGGGSAFAAEERALPTVQSAVGRPFDILSLYAPWSAAAPVASLRTIAANGSVPMLAWGCPPSGPALAAGDDDATVDAYARALAGYGKPVLLRWCWEMNLVASHHRLGGPATFVAGWDRIRAAFRAAGATNVAFVWSPAITGTDPAPYFPGVSDVDWIGVDGYARRPSQTFASLFGAFVQQWSGQGRPLMVAETGARPAFQESYLDSVATALPAMPSVKAVVYFDASGPAGRWALTPTGTRALAHLAASPAFAASG